MRLASGLILSLISVNAFAARADQPYPVQRATEYILGHSALRSVIDDLEPYFGENGGNPFIRRLSSNHNIFAVTFDKHKIACQFDLTQYLGSREQSALVGLATNLLGNVLEDSDVGKGSCFATVSSFDTNQHYAVLNFTSNASPHCGQGGGSGLERGGVDAAYLFRLDSNASVQFRRARTVKGHDCRDSVANWWWSAAIKEAVQNIETIGIVHSISDQGVAVQHNDGRYIAYLNVGTDRAKVFQLCTLSDLSAFHLADSTFLTAANNLGMERIADAIFTDPNVFPGRDTLGYVLCQKVSD